MTDREVLCRALVGFWLAAITFLYFFGPHLQ
jgi:hypothetical protein